MRFVLRWERKKNDLSFYLYCTFRFYASNHPRGEQEIMGKTGKKVKKKNRKAKKARMENNTPSRKDLKKGEKRNEYTANY